MIAAKNYPHAEKTLRELYALALHARGPKHRLTYAAAHDLARVIARQGRKGEALAWLEKAVEGGFRDPKAFADDSDLASLHGDREFERLAAAVRP